MSLHEQKVRLFIHLFKTKPELFKECREELSQLIDQAQDDDKNLSGNILRWCENYPEIKKALRELSQKAEDNRGAGGERLNEEIPDYRPFKETLKNSIQQSFSEDNKND